MSADLKPSSRKLVFGSILLGLFVLLDLGLLGWFIFRSLSEREIEQVLLETRAEARSLADRLGRRIDEEGEPDLYTVVAVERELQTYIDDVLNKREIVSEVEIRDREGKLVFRSTTDAEVPVVHQGPLRLEEREIPANVEERTVTREETYDLEVPIGDFGFVHIGISESELANRIGVLRGELVRQTSVIGAVTLLIMAMAYLIIVRLWARGRRLEDKAIEAERMAYIGTLASGLAHEIRNPLNSLSLNMQMLEEEAGNSPARGSTRRLLSITRSEIGRLERLVTDFLQYAKPRALELREVTASQLLQDCRDLVDKEAQAEGVSLVVEDRSAGARVAADTEHMSQLLLNLVRNALAATKACGRDPEVRLIARREGGRVLLEVLDNGTGIPAGELQRIFEIFYSTRRGGTGLGLAVVQRIAGAHGAELSVQSTPGVGTRFQVALSALRAEAVAKPAPRPATGSAGA